MSTLPTPFDWNGYLLQQQVALNRKRVDAANTVALAAYADKLRQYAIIAQIEVNNDRPVPKFPEKPIKLVISDLNVESTVPFDPPLPDPIVPKKELTIPTTVGLLPPESGPRPSIDDKLDGLGALLLGIKAVVEDLQAKLIK